MRDGFLPDSWAVARLGEVTRVIRPRISPSSMPHLRFIGLEHLEAHTTKLLDTVPAVKVKSAAVHFQSDDVLYARLRPYLNKVHAAEFEGLGSSEFIPLTPYTGLHSKYLMYFLNSSAFVSFATRLNTGDRPRVDFDQIGVFPCPLPPTAEQHRIVAAIEEHFSRLDASVAALKRVRANLKRYRASVLKAACEGRLVPTEAELARAEGREYEPASELLERIGLARGIAQRGRSKKARLAPVATGDDLPGVPEGWTWTTVEQCAANESNAVTDGPFGSNLKTEHYTSSGPRVIRLQNIGKGTFIDAVAHISQEHFEQLSKHQVSEGDLVVAALGESPPRSCIVPGFLGPAIVKADCIRVKPNSEITSSSYLNFVLNSEPTKKRMAKIVHGVGRPRLNLGEVKDMAVPLPPLAEQHRIVAEVDRLLSVVDEAEASIDQQLVRAERLRQSILKRAFEGKLVPQDPNDEPASVLLERIRAERSSPAPRKERRPRARAGYQFTLHEAMP